MAPQGNRGSAEAAVGTGTPAPHTLEGTAPLNLAGLTAWAQEPRLRAACRRDRQQAARAIRQAGIEGGEGSWPVRSLALSHLRDLDSLPPGLVVSGGLELIDTGVRMLPAGLEVGHLRVDGARHLVASVADIVVHGPAYFEGCPRFLGLTAGSRVLGDLVIFRCARFKNLPSGENLGGDLFTWQADLVVVSIHPEYFRGLHQIRFFGGRPFDFAALIDEHAQQQRDRRARGQNSAALAPPRPSSAEHRGGLPAREALPSRLLAAEEIAGAVCPFTLEPLMEADDAVFWRAQGSVHGAAYVELAKWWAEHGTDPSTRLPLPSQALFRARLAAPDSRQG